MQEDEDGSGEDDGGEDNGHDGHPGHEEKIHKLHNCVLKSRVTTVTSENKQPSSVGSMYFIHAL